MLLIGLALCLVAFGARTEQTVAIGLFVLGLSFVIAGAFSTGASRRDR
jgi:hypothetical protein